MPENCTWEYIAERVVKEAEYILQTGATVRACANKFGISKSTVHKDVAERLKEVDGVLYKKVRKVLEKNLSERHIRGGMATRNKYLRCKKCVCKHGEECGSHLCGCENGCSCGSAENG